MRDWGDNNLLKSEEQGLRKICFLEYSRILFDYVEETTYLEQVALFCIPKSVYQSDVVGLDFCEAGRQCDQSNSGLLPGKGVRCPRLG